MAYSVSFVKKIKLCLLYTSGYKNQTLKYKENHNSISGYFSINFQHRNVEERGEIIMQQNILFNKLINLHTFIDDLKQHTTISRL